MRYHPALRRVLETLLRAWKPDEIRTEADSVAKEVCAEAASAVIDRRKVLGRETPLHLAVRLSDAAAAEMLMATSCVSATLATDLSGFDLYNLKPVPATISSPLAVVVVDESVKSTATAAHNAVKSSPPAKSRMSPAKGKARTVSGSTAAAPPPTLPEWEGGGGAEERGELARRLGEESRGWFLTTGGAGVACDGDGRMVGVALDGLQLTGARPRGALRRVTLLPTLSLRDNAIHGGLPGLDGLEWLRVVDLSSNRFSRPIPRGYAASLPALTRLELQDNLLNGTVLAFEQGELIVFNVSYNFLQGEVPDTHELRRFPTSAFDHNLKLCGESVNAVYSSGSPSLDDASAAGSSISSNSLDDAGVRPVRKSRCFRLATWSVLVIALIAATAPFAAVLIFLHQTKKSREVLLGGRAPPTASEDIKDKAEQAKGSRSGSGGRSP